MPEFDVAVVGGGPAGAWAARKLALAGARVVVFDGSHPREKPCGGGLSRRALQFLEAAGLRERVPGVAATSLRFSSGGLSGDWQALMPLGAGALAPLVVVSRRELDGVLLEAAEAAGATWVRERVTDATPGNAGATLRTRRGQVEAAFLLGADGANSLVRRRVRAPFSRSQLSVATGFYAHGVRSAEVAIHTVASPPGYIWSFPRTDHLAIGICAQADAARAAHLQAVVREWTRGYLRNGRNGLEAYSWPIPSLTFTDFKRERPAGSRWMLLGDAAGLVDPLTREGIYFALFSGELAAECLLSKAGDPAETYSARLREAVYPELGRAAALKAGFFTSRFTHLLVEALRRSGKVRAIMEDLVAGRQPYDTLKRRLVGTFEVGLAWRLLMLQVRGMRTRIVTSYLPK